MVIQNKNLSFFHQLDRQVKRGGELNIEKLDGNVSEQNYESPDEVEEQYEGGDPHQSDEVEEEHQDGEPHQPDEILTERSKMDASVHETN